MTSAGISAASANHDGSGITVQVAAGEPASEVKTQIAQAAGLPESAVDYEENVGSLVDTSRNNDAAPWKGGIRTRHVNQGCSTAFAALSGSSGRLLSANHCDPGVAATDNNGSTIAPASAIFGKASIDSMSIDPTASPATTPKMFTGAWNSTSTSTVKNWASNWYGDPICFGGATSGARCGKIVDDAMSVPGLSGAFYVRARATSGALTADGDSGGPVYRTIAGGVQARGVIIKSVTSTAMTCGTIDPQAKAAGARCFREGVYTPISVVLNSWGYSLEVG